MNGLDLCPESKLCEKAETSARIFSKIDLDETWHTAMNCWSFKADTNRFSFFLCFVVVVFVLFLVHDGYSRGRTQFQ